MTVPDWVGIVIVACACAATLLVIVWAIVDSAKRPDASQQETTPQDVSEEHYDMLKFWMEATVENGRFLAELKAKQRRERFAYKRRRRYV